MSVFLNLKLLISHEFGEKKSFMGETSQDSTPGSLHCSLLNCFHVPSISQAGTPRFH